MTDKKDGPGQKDGPAKAGDRNPPEAGGAKRPFATIDLKAVEVPPEAGRTGPVAPKAAQPPQPKAPEAAVPKGQAEAAAKVAAASAAQRGAASGPGAAPKPDARVSSPGSGAASSVPAAGGNTAGATRPSSVPPVSAPPPQRSGSFGSHALAGLVGAVVAVALSHLPGVSSMLEGAGLSRPAVSPEVAQRLAALEHKAAQPPPPPTPVNNAAAEANAKRIDALQQQLTSATESQARTSKQAADLEARLAKTPPIADVGDRLIALEKQLAALGQAALTDPDRAGRIPQLAQLVSRLTEVEAMLSTRIVDARKDATREIDTRVAPAAEASEVARTTAQRIEREVGVLRGETNRIATGLDQVKTGTERLQLGLKAAEDKTAELGTSLDGVRRDLEARLRTTAKPDDVSAAVAPIATKLAALENNVAGVVKSEGDRNATAERIVLSLELGNLKRAMERGAPYARELAEVAKLSGTKLDLAPLQNYRDQGVPTIGELMRSFRPVANAILDADAEKSDGSVVDRLVSGAKTFVRIRRTTTAQGDASPEAAVARIEEALRAGRLGDVLAEAKAIERKPDIAKEWLAKVEARQTVDAALKSIDDSLKASLGGGPAAAPAPAVRTKGQP